MTNRVGGFDKLKNSKKPFRFFLSNESRGRIELYNAPLGWEKSGYSMSRSAKYSGIFRKYALDKLSFVKEGKYFIEQVEKEQGFEAEIMLEVWSWDSINLTYYVDFKGNLKLIDKDIEEETYTTSVIDSSFEDKVINREDNDVIVTKRTIDEVYTSVDGKVIQGFSNEPNVVTLPSRVDFSSAQLQADSGIRYNLSSSAPDASVDILDAVIPILYVKSSETEAVKSNSNEFKRISGAFYVNSTDAAAKLSVSGAFTYEAVVAFNLPDSRFSSSLYVIDNADEVVEIIDLPISVRKKYNLISRGVYEITSTFSKYFSVPKNCYLQFRVGKDGASVENVSVNANINARIEERGVLSSVIECFRIHEAFSRVLQVTTGDNSPLYSNLLGRIDSEPRKYTYNGERSDVIVTNGGLIRGFNMTDKTGLGEPISPLSLSLNKLFNAINTIEPIGMTIEESQGGKVARIEDLKYFFDSRVAVFIDNASQVKKDYNKDLIPSSIEIGYSKFESDEIKDGLFDYNTKSSWINAITSVNNKENIISDYSASNASINQARKVSRQDNPTTDSKYDDTNFIINIIEGDNALKNGDAEKGLLEWGVVEDVKAENILGDNKFVLTAIDNQVPSSIFQNVTGLSQPTLSLSYAIISPIEKNLYFSIQIKATLNNGENRYLNTTGEWVNDQFSIVQYSKSVKENRLQNLETFEISALSFLDNVNVIELRITANGLDFLDKLILDNIFFSDSNGITARTNQGFEYIMGISNPDNSYNIDYSPARCLLRRGSILRAPLDNRLNTSYTFSNSDKISTLVSKKIDEQREVKEGESVTVNDLEAPLWEVERVNFEAVLTDEQKIQLSGYFPDGKQRALGLVAWRENIKQSYNYGWIDDYVDGGFSGVSKFELRGKSKYISIIEIGYMLDDDLEILTDDNNDRFLID